MASIYRRKGSKIWWISYRQNSKAYSESLKTQDRATALFLKNQIELKLAQKVTIHQDKTLTTKDALDRYINHLELIATPSHKNGVRTAINQFCEWSNILLIKDITPEAVEKYLSYRKANQKAWTVKADLKSLKSLMNWLEETNVIPANPIKKVRLSKPQNRIPFFLQKDEARELLEISKAIGNIYYFVAISLCTGIRRGELLRLKWEDFDFDKRKLTIHKSKTGLFRVIPFHSNLKAYLGPIRAKSGRIFDYYEIPKKQWNKIFKVKDANGDQVIPSVLRWHDLRHTYASNLILDGVPIRTVSELLGHKNIATTMIYSHLTSKTLEEAVLKADY